jgi:hypothetical protein
MFHIDFDKRGYQFPPNIKISSDIIDPNHLYTIAVYNNEKNWLLWYVKDICGDDFLKEYDCYLSYSGQTQYPWLWNESDQNELLLQQRLEESIEPCYVQPNPITSICLEFFLLDNTNIVPDTRRTTTQFDEIIMKEEYILRFPKEEDKIFVRSATSFNFMV